MLVHCRHVPKHTCPHLEPLTCTPQEGLSLPPAPQGEKPCSPTGRASPHQSTLACQGLTACNTNQPFIKHILCPRHAANAHMPHSI